MRIWKSLDLAVTLAVSLVVGTLGMLNVAGGPALAGATLATLGALTVSTFHSRLQIGTLLQLTRRHLTERPPAERLLHPSTAGADADLTEATEIDLVGVTLSRTVRTHAAALGRCLHRGGTVRVAVIDPHGPVLGEAARRSTTPDAAGIFAHRLRPTLDLLDDLATASGRGRVEVRLLDFVPAFGLLAVNGRRTNGRLHVDIYSHAFGGDDPALTLEAGRDHTWYQHFLGELEHIWEAGHPRPAAGTGASPRPGRPG